VGELLNSSPRTIYKFQPLFSYALKDYLSPESSTADIDRFFGLLARTSDAFLDQEKARGEGSLPKFAKLEPTHVVYKEVRYHHLLANMLDKAADVRLVAVIRNPLSVIASWVSAPREFRRDHGWQISEEWRLAPSKNRGRAEEFFGFEKWKEAAHIFLALENRFRDRVHVLLYEDLVQSAATSVDRLFEFCGLALTRQTRDFLADSTRLDVPDVYSVYRSGNIGAKWKSVLSPEIIDAITVLTRSAGLGRFLTEAEGAPN